MKQAIKTLSIHVPSKNNLSITAEKAFLVDLAKAAGGYTVTDHYGGWVMTNGTLEHEPVREYTAHVFSGAAYVETRAVFDDMITAQLTDGNQESVLANLGEGPALYFPEDVK